MSLIVRPRAPRPVPTILASGLVLGLGVGLASPAVAAPDRHTTLLSEFATYWEASPYDQTSPETKAATAFRGQVTDAGVDILGENDRTLQAINGAGAVDPVQSKRALIDADLDWKQTFPDALGPVIGGYLVDGLAAGALPRTQALYDALG